MSFYARGWPQISARTNLHQKIPPYKNYGRNCIFRPDVTCVTHVTVSLDKEDQVVWDNLLSIKHVLSRPDIRLFKQGVDIDSESMGNQMLVSVVQVKRDSAREIDEFEENRLELESTHLCSSCSSVSSCGTDTEIELYLNKRVLGQHVGELLLDAYKFHDKRDKAIKRMPGMIVDDTLVFLTLLEISEDHFNKLERNQDLLPQDQASVFYSRPLNILDEDERNILMEIFLRLNNIGIIQYKQEQSVTNDGCQRFHNSQCMADINTDIHRIREETTED